MDLLACMGILAFARQTLLFSMLELALFGQELGKHLVAARHLRDDVLQDLVFSIGQIVVLPQEHDVFCGLSQNRGLVEFLGHFDALNDLLLAALFVAIVVIMGTGLFLDFGAVERRDDILQVLDTVVDVVSVAALDGVVGDLFDLLVGLQPP